jgi:hypothetical protein
MASTHGPGSEASILNGVTVLLVEDSWHVAKAMKSAPEQRGMHVVGPAANTNQARRLAAGERPKLALVDVNLKTELACGRSSRRLSVMASRVSKRRSAPYRSQGRSGLKAH